MVANPGAELESMTKGSGETGRPALRGFISYAYDDAKRVKALLRQLVPAAREIGVEFWTDAPVTAGGAWSKAILDAVTTSDVFVLCLSSAHLLSAYLWDVETPAIGSRARSSGALVIPVILTPCAWWGVVEDYQAVPVRDGMLVPISSWRRLEDGYASATSQIVSAIRHHSEPLLQPEDHGRSGRQASLPPIADAPPGFARLAPADIERAVKTVIARRAAKTVS